MFELQSERSGSELCDSGLLQKKEVMPVVCILGVSFVILVALTQYACSDRPART